MRHSASLVEKQLSSNVSVLEEQQQQQVTETTVHTNLIFDATLTLIDKAMAPLEEYLGENTDQEHRMEEPKEETENLLGDEEEEEEDECRVCRGPAEDG